MKTLLLLLSAFAMVGCSPLVREEPAPPVSQSEAVDSLYQEGRQKRLLGDLAAAQATFERALRIEPGNALLWFELAQVAYEQNNRQEAKELALRARSFVSNDASLKRKIEKLLNRIDD